MLLGLNVQVHVVLCEKQLQRSGFTCAHVRMDGGLGTCGLTAQHACRSTRMHAWAFILKRSLYARPHRHQGAGGSYGDQRAWASIGWGAFGVVGGVAINKYGIEAAPFVGFGLLSALLFVVGACMRYDYGGWGPAGVANRPGDTGDGDNAGRPYQLAADTEAAAAGGGGGAGAAGDASMRALLRRPEIIIFLFEATMLGFGMVRICVFVREMSAPQAAADTQRPADSRVRSSHNLRRSTSSPSLRPRCLG